MWWGLWLKGEHVPHGEGSGSAAGADLLPYGNIGSELLEFS